MYVSGNEQFPLARMWQFFESTLIYKKGNIILVIHNVQGCPHFARIVGRGTWHAGGTLIAPTHPQMKHTPTKQYGYLLEDQRPKQAYCDSDRFQISPFGV